jgi:hypothetical protein
VAGLSTTIDSKNMAQIMPPRRADKKSRLYMSESLYERIKPFYCDKIEAHGKHPKAVQTRKELVSIHKQRLTTYRGYPEEQKLIDAELLTSQLSDRDAQAGESVLLRDGRYKITKVFAAGGGYILFLKPNHRNSSIKGIPKLVCRGAEASLRAQEGLNSIKNDFAPQIARLAVVTNFLPVLYHLKSEGVTRIDIFGKSMGGAIAQQLAVLFEYASSIRVKNLTTLCSTGVGPEVNDFFKHHVLRKKVSRMKITVIRTGGSAFYRHAPDYVPLIGGVHLGCGTASSECSINIIYLGADSRHITRPDAGLSGAKLAKAFMASFRGGHGRQTTLLDFGFDKVSRKNRDEELAMGERMESWRKSIATVVNAFSGKVGEPFADFAERMKLEGSRTAEAYHRRSRRASMR